MGYFLDELVLNPPVRVEEVAGSLGLYTTGPEGIRAVDAALLQTPYRCSKVIVGYPSVRIEQAAHFKTGVVQMHVLLSDTREELNQLNGSAQMKIRELEDLKAQRTKIVSRAHQTQELI